MRPPAASTADDTALPGKRGKRLSRIGIVLSLAAAGGIAFVVFYRSVGVPFWMEDFLLIDLVNRLSFGQYVDYTFSGEQYHLAFLFRPISHYLYWKLGVTLFGLDATGFHVMSLLVHVGNAMLVTVLGARLSQRASVGAISGAIYAVGRVNFDALYHLPHIQDLLVTFLALVTILAYMRSQSLEHGAGFAWLAPVAYALALCSKESAIVIPALLALYELVFVLPSWAGPRRAIKYLFKRLMPFIAISMVYLVMRLPAIRYGLGTSDSGYGIILAPTMIGKYGWGALWSLEALAEPVRAAKAALLPGLHPLQNKTLALGLFFVVLIGALWLFATRARSVPKGRDPRNQVLLFGLGWFLVAPLPIVFVPAFAADLFIAASVGLSLMTGGLLAIAVEEVNAHVKAIPTVLGTLVVVGAVFVSGFRLAYRIEDETEWLRYPYIAQQATQLMARERGKLLPSSRALLVGFPADVFPWSTGEAAVRVFTGMALPTQKVTDQDQIKVLDCRDLVLVYDGRAKILEDSRAGYCDSQ